MRYRKLIDDLESELVRRQPATLLVYVGLNDDGEQYVDIEAVEGHCVIDAKSIIADDIGNETLREALVNIISQLENDG